MLASTNILVCAHVMPGLRKGRRAGVQGEMPINDQRCVKAWHTIGLLAISLGQRTEQTEPFFYSGV
jgi:hypothetical protein